MLLASGISWFKVYVSFVEMKGEFDTDSELDFPVPNHGSVGHSSVRCPLKPCVYNYYQMCMYGKHCRKCHGRHQFRDHSPKSRAKSLRELRQCQRAQLRLRVLIGQDEVRTIPLLAPLATTTPASSTSFLNQMD